MSMFWVTWEGSERDREKQDKTARFFWKDRQAGQEPDNGNYIMCLLRRFPRLICKLTIRENLPNMVCGYTTVISTGWAGTVERNIKSSSLLSEFKGTNPHQTNK